MATALIRPLAWEPPYAAEAALEKARRQKKRKEKKKKKERKKPSGYKDFILEVRVPGFEPWLSTNSSYNFNQFT